MSSILENLSLEMVERAFGKDLLDQGLALYDSGAVIDLGYEKDQNILFGVVEEKHREYRSQVKFEGGRIMMVCECDRVKTDQPCVHIMTLLIIMARNHDVLLEEGDEMEEVLPEISTSGSLKGKSGIDLAREQVTADYKAKLEALTVAQMRDLAARRGIKVSGLRRDSIVQDLSTGLADRQNLKDAVAELSTGAHLVLDLLLILGEHLEKANIKKTALNWLNSVLTKSDLPVSIDDLLDELVLSGLVFPIEGRLELPSAVAAIQEQFSGLVKVYAKPVEKVDRDSPADFHRLVLWLILLSQADALERVPVDKKVEYGGWPVDEMDQFMTHNKRLNPIAPFGLLVKPEVLKRLRPVMNQPTEKIDYTTRLIEQAGFWSSRTPGKLSLNFSNWLQAGFEKQSLDLVAAARSLELPVELDLARGLGEFNIFRDAYIHFTFRSFKESLVKARQILFKALKFLPSGVWIDAGSFFQLIHGLLPEFPMESFSSRPLIFEVRNSTVSPVNFDNWRKSYGLFYQAVLQGPIKWLGICEFAYEDDSLVAFRKTNHGDFLLGNLTHSNGDSFESTTASLSFGKDDLIELNPAEASPEVISLVMQVGNLDPGYRPARGRIGTAPSPLAGYRIDNDGLRRAFSAGWTDARLVQVLAGAAKNPLPALLEERIHNCWQHYGKLHIYTGMTLIQFGDDYCLPELLSGSHLNQSLLYQFNPRLIAVRSEDIPDLLSELRSKGYTPRVMEQQHG